jgi:hypothetical protein
VWAICLAPSRTKDSSRQIGEGRERGRERGLSGTKEQVLQRIKGLGVMALKMKLRAAKQKKFVTELQELKALPVAK